MLIFAESILLSFAAFFFTPFETTAEESVEQSDRNLKFSYSVVVPAVKKGEGPLQVYLPLPANDAHQKVLREKIEGGQGDLRRVGAVKTEPIYGNRYWVGSWEHTDGKPVTIRATYLVNRKKHFVSKLDQARATFLSAKEKVPYNLYLKSNKKVPVSGALIDKINADLSKVKMTPLKKSRAIYDYVVDNMDYKKVGKGWGHGDTYWACSKKYGNCTDFHALFNSIARSNGIPAKFEIGFPIPDARQGEIKGYHCWVQFHLPGIGWVPIDASEAKKNPKKRDLFFGTHPADRIKFSQGRDINLGQKSGTLNYFVYPLIEIADKRVESVETKFSYLEVEKIL